MRSTNNLDTVLHPPLGGRPVYTVAEPSTRYDDRCGYRRMRARLARMTVCAVTLAMMAACQSSAGDAQHSGESGTGATEPGTTQPGDGASIDVGKGPCCLVARDDGVWVMNWRDETIQRIDPARRANRRQPPLQDDRRRGIHALGGRRLGKPLRSGDRQGGSINCSQGWSARHGL